MIYHQYILDVSLSFDYKFKFSILWSRTTRNTDGKLQNHGKKCEDRFTIFLTISTKMDEIVYFFFKSRIILLVIITKSWKFQTWLFRGVKPLFSRLPLKIPKSYFWLKSLKYLDDRHKNDTWRCIFIWNIIVLNLE